MRRILVTGASGRLGPYLAEAATDLGAVTTTARTGGDAPCDLTRKDAVADLLATMSPDVVIHAAALTDVDVCEDDAVQARLLNEEAVANLVVSLPAGAYFVQLSTDQVYPDTAGPHTEGTEHPVNVYGRTKLAGERVASSRSPSLVVRTSFFGPSRTDRRESLSDFVERRLRRGEPVTLFEDVLFSPLHAATLSSLIAEAVERGLEGLFNVGSREGLSKHDFGIAVAHQLDLSTASATRGRASSIRGRAPRPSDLRLDVARFEKAIGRVLPTLREEIERL